MIMKTVSILIVNSRRACKTTTEENATGNAIASKKRKNRQNKMDDMIGKPTPKILESLKRKTHFSK